MPTNPSQRATRRRGAADPVPYDFRRPAQLPRDHARVLEHAGETFARQWSTVLAGIARGPVAVQLEAVEQQTYDDWVAALPAPVVLLPFAPEPLSGTAVLQLEVGTALDWVDQVLGGPGDVEQQQRTLTAIEQDLLGDVVQRVLDEMGYAFEQVAPLRPRPLGLEHNPQFLQVAGATEVVVVLVFSLVGGTTTRRASLLLPLSPVVGRLDARRETDAQARARAEASHLVGAGMGAVQVEVTARLRSTQVDPAELLALRPGDLLRLHHRNGEPLELATADVVVGHAVIGARGNRLACLVVEEDRS